MKKITLNQGKFTIVDDENFEWLNQFRWTFSNGRVIRWENGKTIYMHRIIMNAPIGTEVDHINQDATDNRKENLRVCSHQQNRFNEKIRKNNSSGFKGVSYRKDYGKWRSYIVFNNKQINLGSYNTKGEAARAYNKAAIKYHGEYAALNTI